MATNPLILESSIDPKVERQTLLNLALREAIQKNDFNEVLQCLNDGAWVNHAPIHDQNFIGINDHNRTPLKLALKEGADIKIISLLISRGAELISRDDDWEPLQVAAEYSTPEIVKLLIDHKANVNNNHHGFGIPLFRAYKNNRLDVAKVLIEKGCDVNLSVQFGYFTVLEQACKTKLYDFAKLLIQNGAYISFTSFENAIKNQDIKLLRELLEVSPSSVNIKNYEGKTLLHFLTGIELSKKNELMQCLLDFEPNLSLTDNEGFTALQRFEQKLDKSVLDSFHKKIKEYQINYKKDPDEKLCDETKKLFNETELLLLKMKSTPTLYWLCIHELVGQLLNGNETENLDHMVQVLSSIQATPQLIQDSITEHLRITGSEKNIIPSLLRRLTEKTKDRSKRLIAAKLLILMGMDVNIVTIDLKYTALRYACDSKNLNMVSFLLKHKANPNIGDREGITPINCCFSHSVSFDIFKLLLNNLDYSLHCCRDNLSEKIVTLLDKIALTDPMITIFIQRKIFTDSKIISDFSSTNNLNNNEAEELLRKKCFLVLNKLQAEIDHVYIISLSQIRMSNILKRFIFKSYLQEYTEQWATKKHGKYLLNAMIHKTISMPVKWSTVQKQLNVDAKKTESNVTSNQNLQPTSQNVQTKGSRMLTQFQNELDTMSQDLNRISSQTSAMNFDRK